MVGPLDPKIAVLFVIRSAPPSGRRCGRGFPPARASKNIKNPGRRRAPREGGAGSWAGLPSFTPPPSATSRMPASNEAWSHFGSAASASCAVRRRPRASAVNRAEPPLFIDLQRPPGEQERGGLGQLIGGSGRGPRVPAWRGRATPCPRRRCRASARPCRQPLIRRLTDMRRRTPKLRSLNRDGDLPTWPRPQPPDRLLARDDLVVAVSPAEPQQIVGYRFGQTSIRRDRRRRRAPRWRLDKVSRHRGRGSAARAHSLARANPSRR